MQRRPPPACRSDQSQSGCSEPAPSGARSGGSPNTSVGGKQSRSGFSPRAAQSAAAASSAA
eukprot:1053361-Prymnesium_polylepis.1